jgi:hypothetical protein
MCYSCIPEFSRALLGFIDLNSKTNIVHVLLVSAEFQIVLLYGPDIL